MKITTKAIFSWDNESQTYKETHCDSYLYDGEIDYCQEENEDGARDAIQDIQTALNSAILKLGLEGYGNDEIVDQLIEHDEKYGLVVIHLQYSIESFTEEDWNSARDWAATANRHLLEIAAEEEAEEEAEDEQSIGASAGLEFGAQTMEDQDKAWLEELERQKKENEQLEEEDQAEAKKRDDILEAIEFVENKLTDKFPDIHIEISDIDDSWTVTGTEDERLFAVIDFLAKAKNYFREEDYERADGLIQNAKIRLEGLLNLPPEEIPEIPLAVKKSTISDSEQLIHAMKDTTLTTDVLWNAIQASENQKDEYKRARILDAVEIWRYEKKELNYEEDFKDVIFKVYFVDDLENPIILSEPDPTKKLQPPPKNIQFTRNKKGETPPFINLSWKHPADNRSAEHNNLKNFVINPCDEIEEIINRIKRNELEDIMPAEDLFPKSLQSLPEWFSKVSNWADFAKLEQRNQTRFLVQAVYDEDSSLSNSTERFQKLYRDNSKLSQILQSIEPKRRKMITDAFELFLNFLYPPFNKLLEKPKKTKFYTDMQKYWGEQYKNVKDRVIILPSNFWMKKSVEDTAANFKSKWKRFFEWLPDYIIINEYDSSTGATLIEWYVSQFENLRSEIFNRHTALNPRLEKVVPKPIESYEQKRTKDNNNFPGIKYAVTYTAYKGENETMEWFARDDYTVYEDKTDIIGYRIYRKTIKSEEELFHFLHHK